MLSSFIEEPNFSCEINFTVHGIDESVYLTNLVLNVFPVVWIVVPLGIKLFHTAALLFDPGVMLEIVDSLAGVLAQFKDIIDLLTRKIAVVVFVGVLGMVRPVDLTQFSQPGAVHIH